MQALLPEKRYLFYPNLAKAAGSVPLAHRLEKLQPDIHAFGHTHFSWDAVLNGELHRDHMLSSPMIVHHCMILNLCRLVIMEFS